MPEREPEYQGYKLIKEITSELNQEGIVVLETNDSFLGRVGKLFSEKIKPAGKRITLPASAVILIVAAACADSESQPTPTPTSTLEPTATYTPEPTSTPTPELAVLLETIDIPIPNLSIQKFAFQIEDITNELTDDHLRYFDEVRKGKEIAEWCGNSFAASDSGITYDFQIIYYGRDDGRYFQLPLQQDRQLLAMSGLEWSATAPDQLLCDNRILYSLNGYNSQRDDSTKEAVIIADFNNQTKSLIFDDQFRPMTVRISRDGKRLLLNFTFDEEQPRGAYLLDLNNWQIVHHVEEEPGVKFNIIDMNEDGSMLYKSSIRQREFGDSEDRVGYLIDVASGGTTRLDWPNRFSVYENTAVSPNLKYISRALSMWDTHKGGVVEGQWGMLVYTPSGYFQISSPNISFHAARIDNDGTIYTRGGAEAEVFKFENGTYRLVSTSDGNPLDVDVVRIE